jgi:hypothetical protein
MPNPDAAGRVIAGLLTYNPGPGIYSRLERAIQAMPENVRTQELPGLLKRYKDGVPGWELKAVDLDSVIGQRPAVSREELLQAVKERSPVYTHKELILGGTPDRQYHPGVWASDTEPYWTPDLSTDPAPLGHGRPHDKSKYEDYGQGGKDYTELLLGQPEAPGEYGSHWGSGMMASGPEARNYARNNIVAHARFDTHGDALRINELQSDLGIHNRKQRETQGEYLKSAGGPPASGWLPELQTLPFPLEDSWSDLLIKRLALDAARKGHRAIEVASPRAIADKVGGNIENYEHFYGKVVPGALERLGRKMGGLVEDAPLPASNAYEENLEALRRSYNEPGMDAYQVLTDLRQRRPAWTAQPAFQLTPGDRFENLSNAYQAGMGVQRAGVIDLDFEGRNLFVQHNADDLHKAIVDDLVSRGIEPAVASQQAATAMPRLMRLAEEQAARNRSFVGAQITPHAPPPSTTSQVSKRYIMSDEMRRRLILEGVGASIGAGVMSQDDLIERLNQ